MSTNTDLEPLGLPEVVSGLIRRDEDVLDQSILPQGPFLAHQSLDPATTDGVVPPHCPPRSISMPKREIESSSVRPLVGHGEARLAINYQRLHGEITNDASYTTSAEFEALRYSQNRPAFEAATH